MPVSERKKVGKILFARNENFEFVALLLNFRKPQQNPHVYHPENLPVSVSFINAL
jgi:hypothetical protein